SFAAQQTVAVGSMPTALAVVDLNADNKPDLAVAYFSGNTVSVLLNTTASGNLSFAVQQTFAADTNPRYIVAGDFNADGKPDLAVPNQAENNMSVLVNTTANGAISASFAQQKTFATGPGPTAASVADFDGDGRPDLVTCNIPNRTVAVLVNT